MNQLTDEMKIHAVLTSTGRRLLLCVMSFLLMSVTSFAQAAAAPENPAPKRPDAVSESEAPRPVTGIYGVEIGEMSAYSTYLSPLTYSGATYGILGNWRKAMPFAPECAIMEFDTHFDIGSMLNPRKTARMLDLDAYLSWGMAWRKRLHNSLQVSAGGDLAAEFGMLWLTRNGNNPVAARAYVSLGVKGGVSWHFTAGRLPILLSDDVRIPIGGAFFSPAYGETYYEIYLGNRSGLVHFGYPGNHFTLSNHLAFTLDFGRTALQVGYRFSADTSWINHLDTRIFRHCLTLGVIPGGIGLKQRRHENFAWY